MPPMHCVGGHIHKQSLKFTLLALVSFYCWGERQINNFRLISSQSMQKSGNRFDFFIR